MIAKDLTILRRRFGIGQLHLHGANVILPLGALLLCNPLHRFSVCSPIYARGIARAGDVPIRAHIGAGAEIAPTHRRNFGAWDVLRAGIIRAHVTHTSCARITRASREVQVVRAGQSRALASRTRIARPRHALVCAYARNLV